MITNQPLFLLNSKGFIVSYLSRLFQSTALAVAVSLTSFSSFADDAFNMMVKVAEDNEEINETLKGVPPYSSYIRDAKARGATLTFGGSAQINQDGIRIIVSEHDRDDEEYKAVGYEAYPFWIIVRNESSAPIRFNTEHAQLKINQTVIKPLSNDQLVPLFEKHRSKFWRNALKGGAAVGSIGLFVASGGGSGILSSLSSLSGIMDLFNKGVEVKDSALEASNNSTLNSIGAALDNMNKLDDEISAKDVVIEPLEIVYLYTYFKHVSEKDIGNGAELTFTVNNKPRTFIFRSLPDD